MASSINSETNELEIVVPESIDGPSVGETNENNPNLETYVNDTVPAPDAASSLLLMGSEPEVSEINNKRKTDTNLNDENGNTTGIQTVLIDSVFDEASDGKRAKRRHTDWTKLPNAKEQAVQMVVAQSGGIRPALRRLRNDKILNETGVFDDLPAGTLQNWYQKHLKIQNGTQPERKYPKHMKSIISDQSQDEMFKVLDKLSEDEMTTKCAVLRPLFKDILLKLQPEIFPPPEGTGSFKLSRGWINNIRLKWKKNAELSQLPVPSEPSQPGQPIHPGQPIQAGTTEHVHNAVHRGPSNVCV